MKLSPNEILILNVLQKHKKAMKRTVISKESGISDKNISAKINSLVIKGLVVTEKTRVGKSTIQIVQLTPTGKKEKLIKISIEKKPKKIELTKEEKQAINRQLGELDLPTIVSKEPKIPEKIEAKPILVSGSLDVSAEKTDEFLEDIN